jgi:hypothetical protein
MTPPKRVIIEYRRVAGSYALQTRRPPKAFTDVGAATVAIGVSARAGEARAKPRNARSTGFRNCGRDDTVEITMNLTAL